MIVKLNDIEVVTVKDSPNRIGCSDCVFNATNNCPSPVQESEAGLADGCVVGDHHYEAA